MLCSYAVYSFVLFSVFFLFYHVLSVFSLLHSFLLSLNHLPYYLMSSVSLLSSLSFPLQFIFLTLTSHFLTLLIIYSSSINLPQIYPPYLLILHLLPSLLSSIAYTPRSSSHQIYTMTTYITSSSSSLSSVLTSPLQRLQCSYSISWSGESSNIISLYTTWSLEVCPDIYEFFPVHLLRVQVH